jgi:hypothetical protein
LVLDDGVQNSDATALSSPTLLSVTDDFTVDGGAAGTASGGIFTDQFQAEVASTPEPGGQLPLALFVLLIFVALQERKPLIDERNGGR